MYVMLYFTTKCSFYDCINIYLECYYNIGHKTDKILGLIILIYMCIYVMIYFTTECSFSKCNCIRFIFVAVSGFEMAERMLDEI